MKKMLRWVPLVLLGLVMILAGGAKLAGLPEVHDSFAKMGLPEWFGYFIGLAELLAGIAMFVRKWTALAATGLIPVMIGAAYYHITYEVPSAIPAVIFIGLAVYAIFIRKQDAIWYPV
ncbi:MAG: DoxX family protein [Aliiglaciecola sp.]|uniref:DoxX family protein n=1 Tax=Aliiglaciecola sp. TaxID=1872441 RepID=UPI003297715F